MYINVSVHNIHKAYLIEFLQDMQKPHNVTQY